MAEQLRLAPAIESPSRARHFVADRLQRWGYGQIAPDVALLTSEVVTNAVVHAQAPLVLEVADLHDGVVVAVEDPVPGLPAALEASPEATSGRGLSILDAIASAWGVADIPDDGKVVWFKVAAPI